jgi:hypothetical protein
MSFGVHLELLVHDDEISDEAAVSGRFSLILARLDRIE